MFGILRPRLTQERIENCLFMRVYIAWFLLFLITVPPWSAQSIMIALQCKKIVEISRKRTKILQLFFLLSTYVFFVNCCCCFIKECVSRWKKVQPHGKFNWKQSLWLLRDDFKFYSFWCKLFVFLLVLLTRFFAWGSS